MPAGAGSAASCFASASFGSAASVGVGGFFMRSSALRAAASISAGVRTRVTRSGTVGQVLVDNGQPVEFGQPLMIVE